MVLHCFGACRAACGAGYDASSCLVTLLRAQLVPLPMQACTHPTWRDVAHAGEEEQFMEVSGEWGSRCQWEGAAVKHGMSGGAPAQQRQRAMLRCLPRAAQAVLCDAEAALSPIPCIPCPCCCPSCPDRPVPGPPGGPHAVSREGMAVAGGRWWALLGRQICGWSGLHAGFIQIRPLLCKIQTQLCAFAPIPTLHSSVHLRPGLPRRLPPGPPACCCWPWMAWHPQPR